MSFELTQFKTINLNNSCSWKYLISDTLLLILMWKSYFALIQFFFNCRNASFVIRRNLSPCLPISFDITNSKFVFFCYAQVQESTYEFYDSKHFTPWWLFQTVSMNESSFLVGQKMLKTMFNQKTYYSLHNIHFITRII